MLNFPPLKPCGRVIGSIKMNLGEAASSHSVVRLVCHNCGAHQPVGINELLERFTSETELEIALRLHPCMFCDQMGRFKVVVVDRPPE